MSVINKCIQSPVVIQIKRKTWLHKSLIAQKIVGPQLESFISMSYSFEFKSLEMQRNCTRSQMKSIFSVRLKWSQFASPLIISIHRPTSTRKRHNGYKIGSLGSSELQVKRTAEEYKIHLKQIRNRLKKLTDSVASSSKQSWKVAGKLHTKGETKNAINFYRKYEDDCQKMTLKIAKNYWGNCHTPNEVA